MPADAPRRMSAALGIAAIAARLHALRVFDRIEIGPARSGRPHASPAAYPAARIQWQGWTHQLPTDGRPDEIEDSARLVRFTVEVRTQRTDEPTHLEQLADRVVAALHQQPLTPACLPGLTVIESCTLDNTSYPEQGCTLTGTFAYSWPAEVVEPDEPQPFDSTAAPPVGWGWGWWPK